MNQLWLPVWLFQSVLNSFNTFHLIAWAQLFILRDSGSMFRGRNNIICPCAWLLLIEIYHTHHPWQSKGIAPCRQIAEQPRPVCIYKNSKIKIKRRERERDKAIWKYIAHKRVCCLLSAIIKKNNIQHLKQQWPYEKFMPLCVVKTSVSFEKSRRFGLVFWFHFCVCVFLCFFIFLLFFFILSFEIRSKPFCSNIKISNTLKGVL